MKWKNIEKTSPSKGDRCYIILGKDLICEAVYEGFENKHSWNFRNLFFENLQIRPKYWVLYKEMLPKEK